MLTDTKRVSSRRKLGSTCQDGERLKGGPRFSPGRRSGDSSCLPGGLEAVRPGCLTVSPPHCVPWLLHFDGPVAGGVAARFHVVGAGPFDKGRVGEAGAAIRHFGC